MDDSGEARMERTVAVVFLLFVMVVVVIVGVVVWCVRHFN